MKPTDILWGANGMETLKLYRKRIIPAECVLLEEDEVLWQIGEPRDSDDVYEITTDLPFQIYDIDGDGIDEVICAYDYRLRILDGRNGKEKKSCLVPMNTQDPHTLINIEYNIWS